MGSLQALLRRLDPDPGLRGRQFEHICKWFLETDPVYAPQLKRVSLWRDWPGRWGADAGIDLVAETSDGRLWAIQAKAYAPAYRIKKSDVDTFLSESSRADFSYRLLIATTNHVGATALRTLEAQEKPAHLSLLGDLERADVEWPTSPRRLAGRPARPKTPRSHQKRAIREVVVGLERHDRGQLIMACGTGKTLVALWLAEAMETQRTLILVPSLSLLAQTLREWRANATRPFEALPVCSDETVRGEDLLVAHTNDLPFPVTTDAGEIATFLRKRGPRVVFSTYQSSPKIGEAYAGGRVPGFDLAIADEAHRVAGSVAKDFGTILDARAIPAARRLFMTATPRYVKSWVRRQAEEADLDVASMDDPEKFGPVLHRLTFGEAIQRDLLSDYQVAVIAVDDETVREHVERGTFVAFGDGVKDARTLAAQIGLAKAMRKWGLRRTVSFHSRVDWARRFADSIPEVVEWMPTRQRPTGSLWGDHVSGGMSSGERDVRLNRLRELGTHERGLLSNARCLAEGVDVPTLDGVAFIDPRRSEVDVVQAVGRAIRKANDKTIGTVVLPVFVGRGEDAEAEIETSAFAHVWQVLNALRSHDEALGEELDALRRELGRKGTLAKRPGKIHLLVPTRIGAGFARAFDTRLVERTTASWEFGFGRLQNFVDRHGHSRVPAQYRDELGFRLGSWVVHQRARHPRAHLDRPVESERVRTLEGLPGWTWDARAATWDEAFTRLRAHVDRFGTAKVEASYVDESGLALGSWVVVQRRFKQQGLLSSERTTMLESLSGWVWNRYASAWEIGLSHLRQYVADYGEADVPQSYVSADGFGLGRWVSKQRRKRANDKLGERQIAELTTFAGWRWSVRSEAWEEGFAHLSRFVERNAHPLVPTDYRDADGFALGVWVHNQLTFHASGKMPSDREARLESLPGWNWGGVLVGRWEEAFLRLTHYAAGRGHARVPVSWRDPSDGFALGQWAANQRALFAKGRMLPDRQSRLQALKGWRWNISSPTRT